MRLVRCRQVRRPRMSSPPYDAIALPSVYYTGTSRPRATMWVFGHPGRTCSAQMRIRISSRVRLGTRAALPDSEYLQSVLAGGLWARCSFPPGLSAVYDMHFDSLHCPPPGLAFCSCTTRNAMRSCDHEAVTRVLDAPRAYDFTTRTAPAQQALPFFVAHAAFLDPAGAAAVFSRITTLTVLRAHLRAPQLGCAAPLPCATPLRPFSIAYAALLASAYDDRFRRSPTLPLDAAQLPSHHRRPAQRPRRLFLVGGATFFFCLRTTTVDASPLRLPGLHSTHEHPHARRPACAALDAVRIQIPKRLSSRTRDVPLRRNYLQVRRAAPPTASPSPPAPAVAGDCLQYHHTVRDRPRNYELAARWVRCAARLRRHLMRAIAPPMAYPADTLAIVVPYAAFVVSLGCATVLTSVPPSPLDARACRALQCHPRHVPRPHRTPRSFLIAGAAFVAFSYVATTISCPHRTARVAGRIPNMTPTSPAPAAAAPPAVPALRSKPAPGTHVAYPCA
ncbi:hypothetical protein B0H14DRAFT_3888538 [Mycena olivaceomarginata]|nr:hypothetical protein B0H14DRAFT_3888538 [Mycena olivaceomarginata]